MSQTTTVELLPQTAYSSQQTNITSDRVPAAGYYISKKNLQTFTWSFTSVTGVFTIQATLAESPSTNDWFTVHSINAQDLTEINYVNITGNFVWVRCAITSMGSGSTIQYVKVSY